VTESFFPNQSQLLQEQEFRIRTIAAQLSEPMCLELYSAVSACVPSFSPTTFRNEGDIVIAEQQGSEITFPRPVPMVKMSHIIFGYEQWLKHKYCLPGFVEVEPDDVVVDCGAYVGGFARSAARIGGQVHAFEPDRSNAACAKRNLADFANATVQVCGLYNRSDEMVLNVSANSVEHSLLLPDDGVVIETRRITVLSLSDYAEANGINRYDFVKIEAEGVELEVFDGLGDMRPSKLAIDVSPERNGESPATEFRNLLEALGYEVRQRAHVMFARLAASVAISGGSDPRQHVAVEDRATNSALLPKNIYSLWLQGIEAAPDLIRLNFDRWAQMNPGYRLEILDKKGVDDLLQDFPLGIDRLSPQALSDVVRARLLSTRGGIWVDASVLPTSPLDVWLPSVVTSSGFFAFEKPGPDRPLSSWFLAATTNNMMLSKWCRQVERFWSVERSPYDAIPDNPVMAVETWPDRFPYFWFHYLFQALVDRDPEFAAAWAACRKWSADAPHALQAALAEEAGLDVGHAARLAANAPVHKLNWRASYPLALLATLG
jgi:FkbM family methyltransferase